MTAEQIDGAVSLKSFDALLPKVAGASHVGVFLDFDGTVSQIVPVPQDAELDNGIRSTLEALAAREDFTVSLVSGRALADLRSRVDLNGIVYVGNHGLEIESEDVRFREPDAEVLRRELRSLLLQLKLALCDTEGLEVEDKGLTLAVHFRRVNEDLRDWVRAVTTSTVARSRSFSSREGNMVMDVVPRIDWNKGRAVKWIAREILPPASLAIYVGDDVTDEDAFVALPEGITIKVGDASGTAAQYSLPDVAAVASFLEWLNQAKSNAPRANSQRAGK